MSQIKINDLTFAYEGTYNEIFSHVSLSLDSSWRLALIGRNGRGKTTLLRILSGELAHKGSVSASVDFTLFPFTAEKPGLTVRQIAAALCPQAEDWQLEREFALLRLPDDLSERIYDELSEGEKTKAQLAMLFLLENAFLLIDEPTNHLDMAGRDSVGAYLRDKRGFILVSHDRALIDACCDHVLSINKAGIELTRGNFSVWQENFDRQQNFETRQNEKLKADIERLSASARRFSV